MKKNNTSYQKFNLSTTYNRQEYIVSRLRAGVTLYFQISKEEIRLAAINTFNKWLTILDPKTFECYRRNDDSGNGEYTTPYKHFNNAANKRIGTYLSKSAKNDTDCRGVKLFYLEPSASKARDWTVENHAPLTLLDIDLLHPGCSGYSFEPSCLHTLFDPKEMENNSTFWLDVVIKACEHIPVQFGIVGHVLATGGENLINDKKNKAIKEKINDILLSYPGIDVDEKLNEFLFQSDRIKTVGWLTILGFDAVNKVGGEKKLREILKNKNIIIHSTKYALVIQAGSKPQIGDNKSNSLPEYRAVYNVIKKLQDPLLKELTSEGKAIMTKLCT